MPRTILELSVDAQVIIRELRNIPVGGSISYATLYALTKRDPQGDGYGPIMAARRHLLRVDKMLFEVERGKGLKRLDDQSILGVGPATIRKVGRATRLGIKKLACANYDTLTR